MFTYGCHHVCDGLTKLINEKKFGYEWYVCDCSPMERTYKVLEEIPNAGWLNVRHCPCCGEDLYNGFPVAIMLNKEVIICEKSYERMCMSYPSKCKICGNGNVKRDYYISRGSID